MTGMNDGQLRDFVTESNRIEGIRRPPTNEELIATHDFINLDVLWVKDVEAFVEVVAPGKKLRTKATMNVSVGSHIAPKGGLHIAKELASILVEAQGDMNPYSIHCGYEKLHPFMDGNGRSGRALWAWQMVNHGISPGLQLGFLHAFYYQTLEHSRK